MIAALAIIWLAIGMLLSVSAERAAEQEYPVTTYVAIMLLWPVLIVILLWPNKRRL